MTEHVESCCLSGHPLSPLGRLDGNCVMTCTCQQRATPPAEPTYTEAQIREVFYEHGFSHGSTHGPYAYLDTVIADLRAAVQSPAQPPTTADHEFIPGTLEPHLCDQCWGDPEDHVQRGADTPQPRYDTECTCTPLSQAMCPVHGNVTETVIAEFERSAGCDHEMYLRPGPADRCEHGVRVRGADVPTTEPAELTHLVSRQGGPVPTICGAEGATAETLQDVTCRHCWALVGHVQRAGTSPTTPEEPAEQRAGRDPHCGLVHPHQPTGRCRDGGDDQ